MKKPTIVWRYRHTPDLVVEVSGAEIDGTGYGRENIERMLAYAAGQTADYYLVLSEEERALLRAQRRAALFRAGRYLRWARRTEIALAAYQRTERAAWDHLARVVPLEGSLPEAVARVVDSLIGVGIEADHLARDLAKARAEIARLERELAQARIPRLTFTPPWEEL